MKRERGEAHVGQSPSLEYSVEPEHVVQLAKLWGTGIQMFPASSPQRRQVELELKLGEIKEGRFVSGLARENFLKLEAALGDTFSWFSSLPEGHSLDVIVNEVPTVGGTLGSQSAANQKRVMLTLDSNKTHVVGMSCMSKERVSNITFPLSQVGTSVHGARLSLSLESASPVPSGFTQELYPKCCASLDNNLWTVAMVREKSRRSFYHKSGRGLFRIDLTKTKMSGTSAMDNELHYEAEFEFIGWAFQNPMSETNRQLWCRGVLQFAASAFEGMIDEREFPSFASIYISPPISANNQKQAMQANFLQYFEIETSRFPGTLPRPLTRSILPKVKLEDFRFSEKTDGVRYLLYIIKSGVFLVNRNLDFFAVSSEISPLSEFCQQFAKDGPTILDGEIVITPAYSQLEFRLGFGVPSFMIFDTVSLNGTVLTRENHSIREQKTADFFLAPFYAKDRAWKERVASGMVSGPSSVFFPFFLHRKKQYSGCDLEHLAKRLVTIKEQRYYQEMENPKTLKRFHLTDGLILVHKGPYIIGAGEFQSFKWKYPELISIDFSIVLNTQNQHFDFLANGPNNTPIVVRSEPILTENDADFLRALVKQRPELASASNPLITALTPGSSTNPVIAELSFNRHSGMWHFHRLRDKAPNFISVVFQTMEEIMEEPISIEYLAHMAKSTKIN